MILTSLKKLYHCWISEKSRIPLLKKNQLHPVKLVSQSRSRALLGAAMRSSSKQQNPFLRTLLEATLSASFFYNSKTFSFRVEEKFRRPARVSLRKIIVWWSKLKNTVCHAWYFLQTGNRLTNKSPLKYRQKMVCTLKSDNRDDEMKMWV